MFKELSSLCSTIHAMNSSHVHVSYTSVTNILLVVTNSGSRGVVIWHGQHVVPPHAHG